MAKRKALTKKTRFEVFKRDSFKCQYCGASAPETVLVVDHIKPVSKSGPDDMMNYITACQPCNAGKSDRILSDNTTLQKQKGQIDALNERREQIEMMLEWRDGVKQIASTELDAITDAWHDAAPGFNLNDTGLKQAKAMLKKHGLLKVLDAMEEAQSKYIKMDGEAATAESVDAAWKKVGGFLRMDGLPEDEKRIYYIKGILKNRFRNVPYDVVRLLMAAFQSGVMVQNLELEAKNCRNWAAFETWLANETAVYSG